MSGFPSPAERAGWFAQQFEGREARVLLPTEPADRADYLEQLAHEATHGPADDPTNPQGVSQ